MRPARLVASLAFAVAAWAPRAPAQDFLDRGTFLIERGGAEAGREDFAIQRSTGRGLAGGILAVATVHYHDRDLRPALELTGSLQPVSYQLDVSAGGRVTERFAVQFANGRIAARVATQQRETLREFPTPADVAVLDDDAFHQFYFLPRAAAGGERPIHLFLPKGPRIVEAVVRHIGPDTVTVGGHAFAAERFAVTVQPGDERFFWFTPGGDLLRVAIPARSLVATRTAPPAH